MRSKGFFYNIKKVQGIKYVSLEFDGNIHNSTIGCEESKVICEAFKLARKRNLPVVAFIETIKLKNIILYISHSLKNRANRSRI